uniref:EOG090X0MTI n=1 Tax=Evadne anonyx TaxID=141404 RepID=A0A9N6WU91_9CRUS|nr:EOG090X0MTI [Evadne anonyx]
MAGSSGRYVKTKSSNPFFDDDEVEDVDDDTFLKKAPTKSSSGFNLGSSASGFKYNNFSTQSFTSEKDDSPRFGGYSDNRDNLEDRRKQLLLEKQRIEERTLQSSGRAIGMLYETEQIGISTAEELMRQREQLEKTSARLDDMNNTLRSSDKHIQNIKSVFSSIKNYFSKPSEFTAHTNPVTESAPKSSNSQLGKVMEQTAAQPSKDSQHPVFRIRENDFSHKPFSNVDEQLDEDLGIMSDSLSRLRGLAQGLSSEIEDQNDLIDRVQTSADKADMRISRQNKDMERLLRK